MTAGLPEYVTAGPVVPAEPRWQRLHPVSPALRSWKVFVVLLVFYGQERGRSLFSGRADAPGGTELAAVGALLLLAVVGAGVLGAVSWWNTRYLVDEDAVRLHSGVVFRQQRSAQLDRVQAVDVVRPLVARLLGFAEVRVEVAGGTGSGIRLAYLRRAEAERLQAALLARSQQRRAVGAVPGGGTAGPGEAPTTAVPVLSVPFGRLAGSVALGTGPLVMLALVAFGAALALVLRSLTPLAVFVPALLGLTASIARDLARGGAWTVERTADGLRLRHGLLDRRSQSIPVGRVQAVRVGQAPLWRLTGWWRVEVNVAGYGLEHDGDQGSSTQVVPVCTSEQVGQLLALVLPAPAQAPWVDGRDLAEGLAGTGSAGWVTAPRRARVLDPVGWRRQGVRAAAEVLLLRRGRLWRALDVVPHGRTQSLGLAQGPWQRRLGLSTLVVHSTPGPVRPVAAHLDARDTERVFLDQARRAVAAARREA